MEGTAEKKQRATRRWVKGLRGHTLKNDSMPLNNILPEKMKIRHNLFKTHKI